MSFAYYRRNKKRVNILTRRRQARKRGASQDVIDYLTRLLEKNPVATCSKHRCPYKECPKKGDDCGT